MIDLYTWPTHNGRKISIALEEFDLEYEAHAIDIARGTSTTPFRRRIEMDSGVHGEFIERY